MMKIESLISPAKDWAGGTWAGRVDQAASLLFVHGYITRTQREKITRTIEKQFKQSLAKGEIVPAQGGVTEGGDGEAGSVSEANSTRSAQADAPSNRRT